MNFLSIHSIFSLVSETSQKWGRKEHGQSEESERREREECEEWGECKEPREWMKKATKNGKKWKLLEFRIFLIVWRTRSSGFQLCKFVQVPFCCEICEKCNERASLCWRLRFAKIFFHCKRQLTICSLCLFKKTHIKATASTERGKYRRQRPTGTTHGNTCHTQISLELYATHVLLSSLVLHTLRFHRTFMLKYIRSSLSHHKCDCGLKNVGMLKHTRWHLKPNTTEFESDSRSSGWCVTSYS